jgi:CRISPR/Cas system CMR-associated protein Cmr5 small subunit
MDKNITIEYQEYEKLMKTVDELRRSIDGKNSIIQNLRSELSFIKEKGDGILIIEKKENADSIEFKSTEKDVVVKLVEVYSELVNEHRDVLLEKESLKNKVEELESNIAQYTNEIIKLNEKFEKIKNRKLLKRLLNKD